MAGGDVGSVRCVGGRRVSTEPRPLPGVSWGRLRRYPDPRGSFAEAWRAGGSSETPALAGVQANLSSSALGVLRGLHLHQRQSDLWIVLSGVGFVALVDVRPMLDGQAESPIVTTATLTRDDTVVIPPYVAHGFLAVEPLELLYVVTNEYDGTDELGFAWDDPLVDVAWPEVETSDRRPILSERDQHNPSLRELVANLRG
jgi:dTDP-4-dehydrorhamnose 3,5-epimerase